MNETELRERLNAAADPDGAVTDIARVERRARTLRFRRGLATAIAAILGIAAIALPLSALRHLGESPSPVPSPAAEPVFGDGRIGFTQRDGWSDLRANDSSMCTSDRPFA